MDVRARVAVESAPDDSVVESAPDGAAVEPDHGHGCCDACASRPAVTEEVGTRLRRWAWWLTGFTIAWNVLEALVAIGSGLAAGSIALIGFGLDSVVEVSSALVIVWRLSRRERSHAASVRAERRAVRAIALTFLAIAAYVTVDALTQLLGLAEEPERSPIGLALVALSLVVMPTLAWAKRRVATRLGSAALRADAAETQLCTYLSGVVLVGLAANALAGWWWMDSLAGLIVAALAVREAWAAWTSGELCSC
ncbi:MAG: cation transporter [Chloroflexi bacterium]|nr:cation transporter [Chloroflexota bacterium]